MYNSLYQFLPNQEIFFIPPYDQCDDGCEEGIKAYQKLEAKAMATATMPRPKALKWKKKLPHVEYDRDLDYAHRDYVCVYNSTINNWSSKTITKYVKIYKFFNFIFRIIQVFEKSNKCQF
jgi:hypothetical protein